LAVFYTESNPPNLPSGASPLVINCDFTIGSVGIRPGLESEFYYVDFFSEEVTGFAETKAGPFDPNEVPWTNPNNASLNTVGVYASVTLNTPTVAQNGVFAFDKFIGNFDSSGTNFNVTTPPISPTSGTDWAVFLTSPSVFGATTINPNDGWSFPGVPFSTVEGGFYTQNTSGPVSGDATLSGAGTAFWQTLVALFQLVGVAVPVCLQSTGTSGGSFTGTVNVAFTSPVTAGSYLLAFIVWQNGTDPASSITDTKGNIWTRVAFQMLGVPFGTGVELYQAPNALAGATTVHFHLTNTLSTVGLTTYEMQQGIQGANSANVSQVLKTLNYPFTIPSTLQVLGFEVEISGHQTNAAVDAILTVALDSPSVTSPTFTTQLPSSDGTVTVGSPTENWGLVLTPDLFNNPNFTINVTASALAGSQVTFDIYAVKLKVFLTPNPPPSINYLKTFEETSGETLNLFLGSDGVMYQENVDTLEGALTAVYTAIEPNSFAQSATQSDREFIAISNLLNGTDIPYSYNGINFDRLSQVGPGAPPSCSTTSVGNTILTITQPTAKSEITHPGQLSGILWSAGVGNSSPGNVVTVYYALQTDQVADPDLVPGVGVTLAGVDSGGPNNNFNGHPLDGNYIVTSIGSGIPPGAQFARWFFTIQVTVSQFVNQADHIEGHGPDGTYQVTLATLTTATQVPNLEVGNQFTIAGTGGSPTAGYDGTWTVTATPNASQLLVTSVSRTSNVATYSFSLITGTAPTVGEFVTVAGTLSGNGAFNVTNVVITSVSPGSFSVTSVGADQVSAAESGSAIIFGTIFQFDPLQVVGNKSGGTIATTGVIAAGTRKACYSFLTRNGYITQPSPITTFTVPSGASTLQVSNLLPGPDNTIARIIHLTAAEGGNFYNIPQDVSVIDNGQTVINTMTWVKDNTSTSATLSFSDGVLLEGIQIDTQGNNLFETAELGSSVGFIPYAGRIFSIGEQNKVTNFINWSFDGGIAGSTTTYPAGWTVDPTNGGGGSVIASPIFGNAYAITNSTGSTQAVLGMITQTAFQDEFEVPIIEASTLYSVRITAAVPTGPTTGQIVVDLFSAARGQAVGTFTLQMASLGTTMGIFTGTLLTTTLAPVPNDLTLRLYATNVLNGVQITIDRMEPFPTDEPNLSTIVTGSYINNFEAFDQVTGVISGAVQNQQPIRAAFELFDVLYLVKTKSYVRIRNVDGLEPVFWGTPVSGSQAVGTPSVYGVTSGIDTPNAGEEWAIIAGEAGVFIFNGGEPIKISEEIQQLWNQINWRHGHTLWIQNDIVNRRLLIGVPLKTPNTWLPTGFIPDDSNPTTPNVVLELSYKQLTSANELARSVGVHPTYRGTLITSDYTRKWSVWPISVPAAAFITRSDTTSPIMFGNSKGTGKIYKLIDGQLFDDGNVAIHQKYITYGFPSPEQEQGLQIGSVRKVFPFMTMIIDGAGSVAITALPNTLDTPFATPLLPDITLPGSVDGDEEIPLNLTANRVFFDFDSNAVGSGFDLSQMNVAMKQDPWSPVRGRN
jgi:hypothetical protein